MKSLGSIHWRIALIPLTLALGLGIGSTAWATATVNNFSFGQLDWFDENDVLQIPNSSWGVMEVNVDGDDTDIKYLNVIADGGRGVAWIVKNMPIFPKTIGNASPRQAADFDVTLLGLTAGMDLSSLTYLFSVDDDVRSTPPIGLMSFALVQDVQRRSFGSRLPGVPLPLDVGEPSGVQNENAVKKEDVIQHKDVRAVQEDKDQCLPGAFARSIDWLNRTHKLGSAKNAQQIYDDLAAFDTPTRLTYEQFVAKKSTYLKGLSANAVTKVLDLANIIGPVVGVAEETDADLVEWLKRELPTEDVELHYDKHIVTVTGMYKSGEKIHVKYRDDETQGNAKGDEAEKDAGELKKGADGKYVFRAKNGAEFFKVQAAVSQSIKVVKADQLRSIGPIPYRLPLGASGTISTTVTYRSAAVGNVAVVFTKLRGDFSFSSGSPSADGRISTVMTNSSGAVSMTIVPKNAGPALIQITVPGTSLSAYSFFVGM